MIHARVQGGDELPGSTAGGMCVRWSKPSMMCFAAWPHKDAACGWHPTASLALQVGAGRRRPQRTLSSVAAIALTSVRSIRRQSWGAIVRSWSNAVGPAWPLAHGSAQESCAGAAGDFLRTAAGPRHVRWHREEVGLPKEIDHPCHGPVASTGRGEQVERAGAIASLERPAGERPVHRTIQGNGMPPSNVVSFPSRRGTAEPG